MIKPSVNMLLGVFCGAVIGLGANYLCKIVAGGVCPLTNDPAVSALLGALIGGMVATLYEMKKNEKSKKVTEDE
ncbi:hypothetical protein ACFL5E_01900 [Candidatus Omnitrophota bacterium]